MGCFNYACEGALYLQASAIAIWTLNVRFTPFNLYSPCEQTRLHKSRCNCLTTLQPCNRVTSTVITSTSMYHTSFVLQHRRRQLGAPRRQLRGRHPAGMRRGVGGRRPADAGAPAAGCQRQRRLDGGHPRGAAAAGGHQQPADQHSAGACIACYFAACITCVRGCAP